MKIAFTGPAIVDGIHLERKHLVALAESKGHTVQSKIDAHTDCLVCCDEYFIMRSTAKLRAYGQSQRTERITPAEFLKRMDY